MTGVVAAISKHFGCIEDPRVDRTKEHKLLDIILIAICAAICGADGWVGVERFGNAKLGWLRGFLDIPNGIPSHDTFGRVFARLDPDQFREGFVSWVQSIRKLVGGEVVPIDGKMLRRSHDHGKGKEAIHMVSAWSSRSHLVLGQVKVDEKSNEITALPVLLELLAIEECIVTLDAMGCQKKIAEIIIGKGADYVLALKKNQGILYRDVKDTFDMALADDFRGVAHDACRTVDGGHGRIEIRRCWVISDPEYITYLERRGQWKGLQSIVKVEAKRRIGEEVTYETRYYLSSLSGEAEEIAEAVRGHWGIENSVHWILDVAFREDDCRVRTGHAAENLAILRHIALNLLKNEKTANCGVRNRRLNAAWNESYLLKVLRGIITLACLDAIALSIPSSCISLTAKLTRTILFPILSLCKSSGNVFLGINYPPSNKGRLALDGIQNILSFYHLVDNAPSERL